MSEARKLKLKASASHWRERIEFLAITEDKLAHAAKIELKPLAEGEIINPLFTLSIADAQSLMDDLWYAGLRPTEGSGSAGSLAATERHLKDMRSIVAKKIGIDL